MWLAACQGFQKEYKKFFWKTEQGNDYFIVDMMLESKIYFLQVFRICPNTCTFLIDLMTKCALTEFSTVAFKQ